jgi:hypothetical protein
MTNRIFPKEIMEHSVELYRHQQLRKSKIIYYILLLSFSALLFVIPFVKIDLYKKAPGMIRPFKEINLITNQVNGKINEIFLHKNASQTALMVECFVSPADIGFIGQSDHVKFQIDTFHPNQWGMATGKILHIDSDVSIVKNIPRYIVICSLHETSLFLRNHIQGSLQKGMTLTAMFPISKRTVFQLLFDQMEDWYRQV